MLYINICFLSHLFSLIIKLIVKVYNALFRNNHNVSLDKRLNETWLKKKTKSSKYENMVFIKFKSNVNISNYMTNHFLKDHEYVIPLNLKHYACSRGL